MEMKTAHKKGLRAASNAFWEHSASEDGEDAEAAIKAYLEASNQFLAPREPTKDMMEAMAPEPAHLYEGREESYIELMRAATKADQLTYASIYTSAVLAATNPFEDKLDE